MMNIDLLPVKGRYRGISRSLRTVKIKKWEGFSEIYDEYLKWLSKMDTTFNEDVLRILVSLKCKMEDQGENVEIIFYSDRPEEFHCGEGFLGYDVYWVEEGISGIEDGRYIDEDYQERLNDNGLFNTSNDAQEFCEIWKQHIDTTDQNAWALKTKPRHFCVWIPKF